LWFFCSWRFLLRQRVLYLTACFQMVDGLVDGGLHVARLSHADPAGSVAGADCDFRFVAVFQ
jgi:hypothetical protein